MNGMDEWQRDYNERLKRATPFYWAQPDADAPGRWSVCMNPNRAVLLIGEITKEDADRIVKKLLTSDYFGT